MAITKSKTYSDCFLYNQYSNYQVVLVDTITNADRIDKTEKIFEELPPLQLAILESAALAVKPQGVLVYSTCTIMPQENIEIINQFLAKHPEFVLEDIRKYLPFKTKSKDI